MINRIPLAVAFLILFVSFTTKGDSKRNISFMNELPERIQYLNSNTFDDAVFPSAEKAEPWIIVFFNTHTAICQEFVPSLVNYSINSPLSQAKLGLVNTRNKELAKRYAVKPVPAVYYSVGRASNASFLFPYDNRLDTESIINFSARLYSLSKTAEKSAAVDVTAPVKFSSLAENDDTPSFFFYRSNVSRGTDWVGIVDSVLSIGRANFFVLNEGNLPPRDQMSEKYQSVVDTAQKCSNAYSCLGPNGVVLVSSNDRFTSPRCYCGLWMQERGTLLLHFSLYLFIRQNSFNAIEPIGSKKTSDYHADAEYVGILVLEAASSNRDQVVPTIRDMVQVSNEKLRSESPSLDEEMTAPRIIWTYTDTLTDVAWLQSYGVKFSNLPEVLIIDISRNRFFRASKLLPAFDSVKRMKPWLPGGVQSHMIRDFAEKSIGGNFTAQKANVVGYAAEYLSTYLKLEWLHKKLHYDDRVFVAGIVSLIIFLGSVIILMATNDEWSRENWNAVVVNGTTQKKKKNSLSKKIR